jgi:HAD superfamily 5'-nucleotidase-like hydrolase
MEISTKVFVNRTLNMKRITHIGFDMDHTLIRYKSKNFERLAHEVMCKKLVEVRRYPDKIMSLKFDWNRAIRGLVIDRARGNILKLSRHAAIRQSFHGLEPIKFGEQNKIYKSTYVDLSDRSYDKVDTSFSISYATLYAQLVDLKDKFPSEFPDYSQIAEDLNSALDAAHRDGSLKDVVRGRLKDFILKDKELVSGLRRLKVHGKKIFIVTNSDAQYTRLLMDYAIKPFLRSGETWQTFFEFVITSAEKPRFFYEKTKFRRVDVDTGKIFPHEGPLTAGVYSGGCADQMTADLGLEPDHILYIGDHIYGDIVRLKKDCGWRTALVVEELEEEVRKLVRAKPMENKINALMEKKLPLEAEIDQMISDRIDRQVPRADKPTKVDKKIEALIDRSKAIDKELSPLIRKQQKLFNPYWGEIMRIGIEESYFAYQVDRFACVYFARLSDFLRLSPRTYFRTAKRLLPHEIVIKDNFKRSKRRQSRR